jgi:alanine-glyoxylate transaminase/serine-glyoxylate transaminase/serine-pyruvate transaminase
MSVAGRHFLQIPGPTNVPERVLRAMAKPTIDHRGGEFAALTREILEHLGTVFGTSRPVAVFPASGSGGWEAALVNTLSPGDRVLAFENGEFARLWSELAKRIGLDVEVIAADWRRGVNPAVVQARLKDDPAHRIKALLLVHNETSTGATTDLPAVRKAIDAARHPALLLVDAVSSLASMEVQHDEWGIDVTLAASQKGLMLPPGLSFNAVSEKALAAAKTARLPRSYWSWEAVFAANALGSFPYTPSTNLLYGLREAFHMLLEEGLPQVFARHRKLASAARAAVKTWGLDICCSKPEECSSVVTTVMMPEGHDSEALRAIVLDRFNMSLGAGLGKLKGKTFRIGHLGDFNELMLAGTLAGVEMGLTLARVPSSPGGVHAAMADLIAP